MNEPTLRQRLDALDREQGRAARSGLVAVRYLLLMSGRSESDVIGLVVMCDGRRREFERCGNETLDELEERANPRGSWRAVPLPICGRETRALTAAEWSEAVQLAAIIDAPAHDEAPHPAT